MKGIAAIAAIVCLGITGLFVPSGAAAFCDSPTLVNYSAPLEALPKLHEPVPGGQLFFGPGGLHLRRIANGNEIRSSHLVVPPEADETLIRKALRVGYMLVTESGIHPSGTNRGWTATASLSRISADGKRSKLLSQITKRVAPMTTDQARNLAFDLNTSPAIYRVDVVFKNGARKTRGRFGEYLRVMKPMSDLRLTLNTTQVHPGDTIVSCIENYGNTSFAYGPNLDIEAFDGATWKRAPFFTPPPEPAIGIGMGPGTAEHGPAYTIPSGAPPGLYRMEWVAGSLIRTAQFEILPAS